MGIEGISFNDTNYNRLILIGNGLDLALGLPTTYHAFLLTVWKGKVMQCISYGFAENSLFSIELTSKLASHDTYLQRINSFADLRELILYVDNGNNSPFTVKYKIPLFKTLVNEVVIDNWIDLEVYYFGWLSNMMEGWIANKKDHANIKNILFRVNEMMDLLTIELHKYLTFVEDNRKLDESLIKKFEPLIRTCFEPSFNEELNYLWTKSSKHQPEHVTFLNFNYTGSLQKLLARVEDKNYDIIPIHGQLNNENNPIIFGYGDDTDNTYLKFEESGEFEFLRKIKSFQYPRTSNYHKLLDLLAGQDFEVFVIGHSCGVSDKTMLNTIFEHENCKAIRIFHHEEDGQNEHFYKRMTMARHFSNKALMRERVISYNPDLHIPQFDD